MRGQRTADQYRALLGAGTHRISRCDRRQEHRPVKLPEGVEQVGIAAVTVVRTVAGAALRDSADVERTEVRAVHHGIGRSVLLHRQSGRDRP
jgi:hypothetical protein